MYFVYMLKTISSKYNKTYVGYTNNLARRIKLHNMGKGAKSTKGFNWKIIYKKRFKNKSLAMIYEYQLKNDKKKRNKILIDSNG